jgi:hypothetical protein
MEVIGQLHALAALLAGKELQVPIGRLGGPQSRSGRSEEKKNLELSGIETESSNP